MFNIKNQFLALLIIIFSCLSEGYAQVILGGDGNSNQIEIDYSAPKSYEVGGITASGTRCLVMPAAKTVRRTPSVPTLRRIAAKPM